MNEPTREPNRHDGRLPMKTRFPLSLKLGLGLALNLVVLLAVAAAVFWPRGGVSGWLAQPVGDRLQVVADAMAVEFNAATDGDPNAIVADYAERYGLTMVVYENNGDYFAGEALTLPRAVVDRLRTPATVRPPPPPPPLRAAGGPPGANRPAEARAEFGRGPNGRQQGQPNGNGRIWMRAGQPPQWWAGIRLPLHWRGAPPRPGTLFAVSDSAFAFGRLLDLRPVAWAVLAALGVSVLFWAPFVIGMTRELRAMMHATGRIAEGRFETRIATRRGDEIGRLGESINQMAMRLDALVNGQKKFLADVAHELGSPVGRLQVGTSILDARVDESLRPAVADVREDVQQMSELIGELLAFTRADLGATAAQVVSVELAPLVAAVLTREAAGATVTVDISAGLRVRADEALLARALGNLVRNAVRHAGDQAQINLAAAPAPNGGVGLTITDDGPGVPAAALARLGEPFYRPDAARTREAGGVGLGLSIVKTTVAAMNGTVRFANRPPRGFEVKIELEAG